MASTRKQDIKRKRGEWVSKAQLGTIIGKSSQWMQDLLKEEAAPQPTDRKYNTADVVDYIIKRNANTNLSELDLAKVRLTEAQAELKEIELQEKEGSLLDASETERAWTESLSNLRARLLAIPSTAAASLQGIDGQAEQKDVIETLIIEALVELSGAE